MSDYENEDYSEQETTINENGQEDYYAFLNVSKSASMEDIRNAYKLLSKRFHPDKHRDPKLKLAAEMMFNRLKKVYDILSDPQKREIYDTVGASGIETDGWALVERKFKSAQEIREEYEQLLKEKEERRLQQRTNPKGSITVLIDATDLFEHYDLDDENEDEDDDNQFSMLYWPTIEVRSMTISQSIETPLTYEDNVILSGNLNVRNGVGSGTISSSLRHVFSPTSWLEAEFGAGNGPVISTKYFRTLSENIHGTAQMYFHVTPYGIRPGLSFVLTRQFSKNFIGYMNWKAGGDSSLSTVIVYENQLCRVNSSVSFGLRNSYVSSSYTHKFKQDTRVKLGFKFGTLGAMLEYGIEAKASQHSTIGAAMTVGTHTGVTLRLRLNRNQQNYIFPIILSEQILPSSVFYGTLVPILGFYCVKSFFIDPYLERKNEEHLNSEKEANVSQINEKRTEAITYRSLMMETYNRIVERESLSNGLIIERAVYGDPDLITLYIDGEDQNRSIPESMDAFDVTIAVQCMLNDSSVITFSEGSKSFLPGFYDCNFGREKKLLIRYRYQSMLNQVILCERESSQLPNDHHRIR